MNSGKHIWKNMLLIVFILIIVIHAIDLTQAGLAPSWARKGIYLTYLKRVSGEVISSCNLSINYSIYFNGTFEEKARYTIVMIGEENFAIEKNTISLKNRSNSSIIFEYLSLPDKGQVSTLGNNTNTTLMIFEWQPSYEPSKHVVFTYKSINDLDIPWADKVYIYLHPAISPEVNISLTKTIPLPKDRYGPNTYIVNEYHALYDSYYGFLKELRYVATLIFIQQPCYRIVFEMNLVETNLPQRVQPVITENELMLAIPIALIIAIILFYIRMRR